MNWQSVAFDWNQARAFLVTAKEGSLSAAARALGLTQPTLGRQVAALEEDLGVALFERTGQKLALTPTGRELLEHVEAMAEAATQISLKASGQSQDVAGKVCLATTDLFAVYLLPPILKELRNQAPSVEVEIQASNALADLRTREADIGIRHVRPDHATLVAKLLRETTAHFYASPEYLEARGTPQSPADLSGHDFVGFSKPDRFLGWLKDLELPITADNVRLFSEDGTVAWEMVKRGLGIGIMLKDVAERTPEVVQILPEFPAIPVPIWLTTHRELHTSRRIRLVFDLLSKMLGQVPTAQSPKQCEPDTGS
ncbi:LysR family transcriptional regulator [Pseudovibrio exalbescens]|uniref:LysR family transcriptional regulator n=1 Tax=Pseudovibrio exalbescens TaxID=197461 RepID=UPI002365F494|nr:LysR family transcriptional regulator [Pseudovibrio exalbescens]MDD7911790.1 LysR family transcriptional regulator [Pseudovibrio exalbescens]